MFIVCNASIPEPSDTPSTCGRATKLSGREGLDRPPYTRTEVLFLDAAQPQHISSHPDDASTTRSTRPSVGGSPRREWLHQSVCRTCTRVRPCPSIPSSDGAVLQPRIRLWTPPSVVHSWVRRRRPSSALTKPIEVATHVRLLIELCKLF